MSGVGTGVDFSNKEEVREYLDNLGIEYRFGCYKEKNAEVCHLLGDFLQAIEANDKQAYITYFQNCKERNFGHSCERTGLYKYQGKGECGKSPEEGLIYLQKACDLNFYPSCFKAGASALWNPNDKTYPYEKLPSRNRALNDLRKGCEEGGIGESCQAYAMAFLNGVEGLIEPNIYEGRKFAELACDKGVAAGCFNVSRIYKKGLGDCPKDEQLSRSFFLKYKDLIDEFRNPAPQLKFGETDN